MHKSLIVLCLSLIILSVGYLLLPYELDTGVGRHIFWQIKLPILLTAILTGSALSSSSAVLQVVLRNPLADPGIIGIASGASLMAAIYFAFVAVTGFADTLFTSAELLAVALPILCFIGAMLSSSLIFLFARRIGNNPAAVILVGIAVSTLFGALIAWLYLVLPPMQIQNLTFWLMGSLRNTTWLTLFVALPLIGCSFVLLLVRNKQLNWLFLGEQAAQLRGLDVRKFQSGTLLLVAILIGTSVAIAGSIAFIGLIVPHLLRLILGNDNRVIVPASGMAGAIVLVSCAIANEHIFATPVPLSMITASIGAPVFIYLLLKHSGVTLWQNLK
ncbi:FecCD family ABC transporter permease [Glaciecola sp. 1036]|uniref:FecCD family ABC transporter permease n=1 Tax=Alteromonadaceae TaxID=72275 RepID=UPI003D039C62